MKTEEKSSSNDKSSSDKDSQSITYIYTTNHAALCTASNISIHTLFLPFFVNTEHHRQKKKSRDVVVTTRVEEPRCSVMPHTALADRARVPKCERGREHAYPGPE